MPHDVIHNPSLQRFELCSGEAMAVLEYSIAEEGRVSFDHTHVPESLRGQGLAAILTQAALTTARQQGWRVIPQCSYVEAYLKKHPEFSDLL